MNTGTNAVRPAIAQYWLTAARAQFAQPPEWRSWADRLIGASVCPPSWIIDMSLSMNLDDLRRSLVEGIDILDGLEERGRDLRAFTGWGDTQLKIHLGRLVELEYILTQRDPAHLQGLTYELLFDGEVTAERPHLSGLIDVEALRNPAYDPNRSGENANRSGLEVDRSGSGRPPVGGWSGPGRASENYASGDAPCASAIRAEKPPENAGL